MADPGTRSFILRWGIGFEGGLLLLAWLLGWLVGLPPLERWSWSVEDAALGVAAVLPLLVLYLLGMRWPLGSLKRIKQVLEEVVRPLFQACTALDLVLISLLAGLGEEALFRGVLQEGLGRWLGPWPGLLLASALFGLAHCVTPTYAVLAALIGVYLGGLWLFTGNLLVVVVTHALYDLVILILLRRRPSHSS